MGCFDYEKKSDYLICIDSDGCAMDTMEIKHRECFGPQWIYTYGLGAHFEEYMKIWLDINLYSSTRGINRFKALALALKEVERQGSVLTGGLEEFVKWTEEADELSNRALLVLAQKSKSECIEKALLWSIRTNRAINYLPPHEKPFENVKFAMDEMCKKADLVAVSAANREAIEAEWEKHELKDACRRVLSQEAGTKPYCIGELLKKGYDPGKVLMVGAGPVDKYAATKNSVRFYPILVGKEAESWMRLKEEVFPKLLEGSFDDEYQAMLIHEFEKNLGI